MVARGKDEAKQKGGGQYGSAGPGDGPGNLESGNLKRFRAYDVGDYKVTRISFDTWGCVRIAALCCS